MSLERHPVDAALGSYLDALARPPAGLDELYRSMEGRPGAGMMTHPDLGALLAVLVAASGGRAVLEVGTFVGTSAAWMASALAPGGRIDSLEADAERAARASSFLERAGVGDRVRIHVGPAARTLPHLEGGAYDLCYIDADKTGYPLYLEHAIRLVRPGGLIVADNVFRHGLVAAPAAGHDEPTRAVVGFTRTAVDHPRLRTAVVPVGDGITISAVLPA
ncbi:MAG: O-methyltransferase [Thermoleophilia bacterium]